MWRSLPLIEDLQTQWEKKHDGKKDFEWFRVYRSAIQDGLDKLKKYYTKFDEKPAYILALSKSCYSYQNFRADSLTLTVLHPYYKLDYIKLTWGSAEEQADEQIMGNLNAKNWQDDALKIFEQTVWVPWESCT